MRKLKIWHYILIFVAAVAVGMIIRQFDSSTFLIVKNSNAYAPTLEPDKSTEQTEKKININTASEYELTELSGIGEKIAARIVEYRTKNGKFEVIQDIMKVSGIGDKKFEDIKDYITVE